MPRSCPGRLALAVALSVAAAGCAGPSAAHKTRLSQQLARRDWAGAEAAIEEAKEKEYGEKNSVLYYLDKAAVLHYAGRFEESDGLLDAAELRMDELYTRSVTRAAGTLLLNDATEEYAGEPHERALLHVLRAMNHVFLGREDEAVVEARKVSAFLGELHDALEQKPVYRDDAFAHYLAALLFEDVGREDDARISLAHALEAYRWYEADYGTAAPPWDGRVPDGAGEIVLLHYNGVAPRRGSETFQVAWGDALAAVHATGADDESARVKNALVAGVAGNAVTVAFPVFIQDDFTIRGSVVSVGDARAETRVVQDISAISRKVLADKVALIRVRAIARATVKFLLAKLAEEETKKRAGAAVGMLAGLGSRLVAAATEVADTRCWGTIPAEIRMARLAVAPGRHAVSVDYLTQAGVPVKSDTLTDVAVEAGKRTYVAVRTAE